MNKKALIQSNLIYLLLLVIFVAIVGGFIGLQMNGASIWGQYYSKNFASVIINQAQPGDEFVIDIHEGTRVSVLNSLTDLNNTITFNNYDSEVCAQFSRGRKTCYNFFNNVNITEKRIIYGRSVNLIQFKVTEK